jgi:hypothetical protein
MTSVVPAPAGNGGGDEAARCGLPELLDPPGGFVTHRF